MSDKKQKADKQVELLKTEIEDTKSKYLRALADYQNLERRLEHEKERVSKETKKGVILKLLPFLDNMQKAEIFVKDQGLKMVKESFLQVLAETGLQTLELAGSEFDPELAEAVEIVEGERDNIIIEVLRDGYRLEDKVIRPAQVKVSKIRN